VTLTFSTGLVVDGYAATLVTAFAANDVYLAGAIGLAAFGYGSVAVTDATVAGFLAAAAALPAGGFTCLEVSGAGAGSAG
jgi:hypothetical protein